MNQSKDHVLSPCVENCILNDKKICAGCFRSLVEIAQWQQMDDRVRLDVLDKAENRRKAHGIKRTE
jgi:predicted Fe-S protein YdhL (DUF1289 family)